MAVVASLVVARSWVICGRVSRRDRALESPQFDLDKPEPGGTAARRAPPQKRGRELSRKGRWRSGGAPGFTPGCTADRRSAAVRGTGVVGRRENRPLRGDPLNRPLCSHNRREAGRFTQVSLVRDCAN